MSESPSVGRILVVTGTDTGVGKTVVSTGLARALTKTGLRVRAIKPVETGCGDGVSRDEDGARLAAATGQVEPPAALLRLKTPVTPSFAADIEGISIDLDDLVARIRSLAREVDVTIVEGAGGVYAPITWERNLLDVARALDASVLVVASDRLGTINHTVLTLRALEDADIAAVILSAPETPDASTGSNARAIVRHAKAMGIRVEFPVGSLSRVADVEDAAAQLEWLAAKFAGRWIGGENLGLDRRNTDGD